MAELKTQKTTRKVTDFLDSLENEQRREDSYKLLKIMKEVTGEKPAMWGESIIGFGNYTYTRKGSKEEHQWMRVGFSPRKAALSIYLCEALYDLPKAAPEILKTSVNSKPGSGASTSRK